MGQGGEYFAQQRREDDDENQDSQKYTDRSAQLRATLNSLAMMNVANVINARKKAMGEQRERNRNSAEKNKRENAEKELEEEFYNIARELAFPHIFFRLEASKHTKNTNISLPLVLGLASPFTSKLTSRQSPFHKDNVVPSVK